jgi:hypothetical protein
MPTRPPRPMGHSCERSCSRAPRQSGHPTTAMAGPRQDCPTPPRAGPSSTQRSGSVCRFSRRAVRAASSARRPRVGGSDPFGQFTVGRNHDHLTIRFGDGGDHVVALAGRMHNLHAVHVRLIGSRPGSALEHDGHGWAEPSRGHRRSHSFREVSCSAWPIAPPASWARPDHIGGVNHQHPNRVAQSRTAAGSKNVGWRRRRSTVGSRRCAVSIDLRTRRTDLVEPRPVRPPPPGPPLCAGERGGRDDALGGRCVCVPNGTSRTLGVPHPPGIRACRRGCRRLRSGVEAGEDYIVGWPSVS